MCFHHLLFFIYLFLPLQKRLCDGQHILMKLSENIWALTIDLSKIKVNVHCSWQGWEMELKMNCLSLNSTNSNPDLSDYLDCLIGIIVYNLPPQPAILSPKLTHKVKMSHLHRQVFKSMGVFVSDVTQNRNSESVGNWPASSAST